MQDYFPHNSSPSSLSEGERQTTKMVPAHVALTRKDLFDLRDDLKLHFTFMLDQKLEPVSQPLPALTTIIKDVSTTVDTAYDLAKSQEHIVKKLQVSEGMLKDRLAWLETKARALHLKFWGCLRFRTLITT